MPTYSIILEVCASSNYWTRIFASQGHTVKLIHPAYVRPDVKTKDTLLPVRISALRLAKQIGVSWITASRILRKIRMAMGHRDSIYRLHDLVEIDDALVGGRRSGKRGRGAEGKSAVLVAVENRGSSAGFIAMQQVPSVAKFVQRRLPPSQRVRSDALASLAAIGDTQHHAARVTPSDKAGEWLPWVHVAIGNLKAFLLGTYHGVSSMYLQEYLNEFCYRFNRRQWEAELPLRLLNACLTHTQVKLKTV